MPLRVKCRCGQELVVRYTEWVYVFLGIALLSLILNTVVLLLLYFRLESVSSASARGASSAPPATTARANPRRDEASPAETSQAPKESVAGKSAQPASASVAPPPPLTLPPSIPPSEEPVPKSSAEALHSRNASAGLESLSEILSEPRPPWNRALSSSLRERATAQSGEGSTRPFEQGATSGHPSHEPLAEGGPLARLLLIERERGDFLLVCGLLLDPDPVLRRRAMTILLSERKSLASRISSSEEARALLAAAAPSMRTAQEGRELLEALGIAGTASSREAAATSPLPAEAHVAGLLDALRERAARELSDAPATSLRRHLEAAASSGVDVVLAIDISQSMEGAFEHFQRDAVWLLPALTWALPGIRVGLVLYRDGVEAEMDFSLVPASDVLRALEAWRAEGGGDVPEGVDEALKAALSLGRLHWRESADKHIVLIGDAPPPHAQAAGLLSVLRQAYHQGSYRVHALGVRPEEGRTAVPLFPEIAKAGGGHAVTVMDASRLGAEVFHCLFPEESRAALDLLLPAAKALFSPNG